MLTRFRGLTPSDAEIAGSVHPDVTIHHLNQNGSIVDAALPATQARRQYHGPRHLLAKMLDALAVPDASAVFWNSRRTFEHSLELVRQLRPALIVTTSPPTSTHALGRKLSEATGIPWIADFRDPYLMDFKWIRNPIKRLRFAAHARFERALYDEAAATIEAIPLNARWVRRRYPALRGRVYTLPNGFPVEFNTGTIRPLPSQPPRRSIRTIGSVDDADLLTLAKAIAALVSEGCDLDLTVVGRTPRNVSRLRTMLGMERLVVTGPIAHVQAIRHILGADVLVSFLSVKRSRTFQLSSKLFEFVASGVPFIEINPSRPDERFLRGIAHAQILRRPSLPQLMHAIRKGLAGIAQSPTEMARFRAKYNRRAQVQELAKIFEAVSGSPVGEMSTHRKSSHSTGVGAAIEPMTIVADRFEPGVDPAILRSRLG